MPISTRNTQFTSQIRYRAKEAAATATVKVSALPGQEVSFAKEGDQTATYGDAFENVATNATATVTRN